MPEVAEDVNHLAKLFHALCDVICCAHWPSCSNAHVTRVIIQKLPTQMELSSQGHPPAVGLGAQICLQSAPGIRGAATKWVQCRL